jgi:very-short-patch-repair endonuclease
MGETIYDRIRIGAFAAIDELIEDAESDIGSSVSYDSPIEEALAVGLQIQCVLRSREVTFQPKFREPLSALAAEVKRSKYDWAVIWPQVLVDNYRVDFVAAHRSGLDGVGFVAVECDGHQFHERNKKQATRDKARDRDLQSCGFRVLRFTGTEIWNDPVACAGEVVDLVRDVSIDASCARHLMEIGDIEGAIKALKYAH